MIVGIADDAGSVHLGERLVRTRNATSSASGRSGKPQIREVVDGRESWFAGRTAEFEGITNARHIQKSRPPSPSCQRCRGRPGRSCGAEPESAGGGHLHHRQRPASRGNGRDDGRARHRRDHHRAQWRSAASLDRRRRRHDRRSKWRHKDHGARRLPWPRAHPARRGFLAERPAGQRPDLAIGRGARRAADRSQESGPQDCVDDPWRHRSAIRRAGFRDPAQCRGDGGTSRPPRQHRSI